MQEHGKTLDPSHWQSFRQQAHKMLDDMLEHLENIGEQPVWQPIPDKVRERFRDSTPRGPSDLADVHNTFLRDILPYGSGNAHPGFLGWVQGGGTPVGMLAEMLAAGMNANLGGREHVPLEVERQITAWMRHLFGFPEGSSGLFVTGTSMANLTAVVTARDAALKSASAQRLTAYASTAVHVCIGKALKVGGICADSLRLIQADGFQRIDVSELERTIAADREAGFTPFLVVGTAGTVDIGAIDDLAALAELCRRQNIWFHVDGAYAALAILAPDLAPRLNGIQHADSLAFDFHKWGQVPYSAGFLLVRHGLLQREAFACSGAYLRRENNGLAAGTDWPCDFGIDLSRGFQALKTWFTLKVFGTDAIGAAIWETCCLAGYLEKRVIATPELELMAPVQLNIVCFRFRANRPDKVNARIVVQLHESGEVAPSTTTINGCLVIRAAIVNHRTTRRELDLLVQRTVEIGHVLVSGLPQQQPAPWKPWHLRQTALRQINLDIALSPGSIDLLLRRAELLGDLGRTREARDQYLEILSRDPSYAPALNSLGTLLYGTGYRTAAHTCYSEAVAHHPCDVTSLVNLAHILLDEGNAAEARVHYSSALQLETRHAEAHQGMARALLELGDEQQAEFHRQAGYRGHSLAFLPYRGQNSPVELLLLVSAKGGNIPLRHILDDQIFRTVVLTADYHHRQPLPFHHVAFNSIGDSELAWDALRSAELLLAGTQAAVLNDPQAVLATGRAANAARLRNLPGVITPLTLVMAKDDLAGQAGARILNLHGFEFPLLLRTPGFHTGRYFVKVEHASGLAASLAELPGKHVTVIQYLDARGSDGKSRKYRVMMIDGELYPLHLAVGGHWKIHYFTAEMASHPEHRAEDALFLKDMFSVLGKSALEAIERIQSVLDLDYAGIDFGLNDKGELLLFEANATMVVMPPEPQMQWAYRKPAVEEIHAAVRKMLLHRAISSPIASTGQSDRMSLTVSNL